MKRASTSKRRGERHPPPKSPGGRVAPPEEAWTIPSSWYWDPERHRLELDRVFARSWQAIGRTAQAASPGSWFAADVAGESIVAVHGKDDRVRAFHNVCRHRAGAVVRGEGCTGALQCTYHGWTYALDGSLVVAPEMDGVRGFDRQAFGLRPVRCESWGPYVFVNLDPRASPLSESLGPLFESARRYRLAEIPFTLRATYEIACNWKVYVDNYLEGYHIPRAHPGLNRLIDYGTYTVHPNGWTVTQVAPPRRETETGAGSRGGATPIGAGTTVASAAAGRIYGEKPSAGASVATVGISRDGAPTAGTPSAESAVYLWLWPNFMINLSYDYVQTNVIVPLGPERTLTVFDYYFGDEAGPVTEERVQRAVAFSDEIQREDIAICESVQKNLRSRSYEAGRYCPRRENGLYHFHKLLRDELGSREA